MSYIYESDRRKRIGISEPSLRRLSRRNRGSKPRVEPKIAWNGNEDLREYTWSNLPNVFDCASSSEERYLTGIASMKLSPHPRCLLSLSPTPWMDQARATFSEARQAIDLSSVLYMYIYIYISRRSLTL